LFGRDTVMEAGALNWIFERVLGPGAELLQVGDVA
jgi:hypothetical protein